MADQQGLEGLTGNKVGIWREMEREGEKYFVRDTQYFDEFVYWAGTHAIKAQKETYRVVLLGESAARGFLIDPVYNPAIALRGFLAQADLDAEVVDLARTNCSLSKLETLVRECMLLEPDAVVVFAGNNWIINSRQQIGPAGIAEMINSALKGEPDAMKNAIEEKLDAGIDRLYDLLTEQMIANAIPVFVVNPEFNLRDWRLTEEELIPLYATEGWEEWYQQLGKAVHALGRSGYAEAEEIAGRLVGLQPTNGAGHLLLAESYDRRGLKDKALSNYRLAHDKTIYQPWTCPGVTSFIQEKIRERAGRPGFFLIDLPGLFLAYTGGQAPGRELFLDYCHLTAEGIDVAMGHVARSLLQIAAGMDVELRAENTIGAMDKAATHFLAAIHNAHWGQSEDIVYYHCRAALTHADLREQMVHYILTASGTCPWRLNRHFETLIQDSRLSRYLILAQPEEGVETFDPVLVRAMKEAMCGEGSVEARELQLKEHIYPGSRVDLLKSRYWLDYNKASLRLRKASYFREINYYSAFHVIADGRSDLRLEIVLRLPYAAEGMAELYFNGERIRVMPVNGRWRVESLVIPADSCLEGDNELRICWPLGNVSTKYKSPVDRADVLLLYKYMYPVLGEVHSFSMTPVMAGVAEERRSVRGQVELQTK